MVVGLVGLLMMAIPAFKHHGHVHAAHGGHGAAGHAVVGHAVRAGAVPRLAGGRGGAGRSAIVPGNTGATVAAGAETIPADAAPAGLLRFVPSPRAICSVLALYGAFGNALDPRRRTSPSPSAARRGRRPRAPRRAFRWCAGVEPALPLPGAAELSARGAAPVARRRPSCPSATAAAWSRSCATGALVQLAGDASARTTAPLPVKVGDRLRIEDVDAAPRARHRLGRHVQAAVMSPGAAMPEPSLIIAGVVVVLVVLLTWASSPPSCAAWTPERSCSRAAGATCGSTAARARRSSCRSSRRSRVIPAQAINVDIEITDQTADVDATGRSAPVKVTVRASAIVSVGEDEAMVNTAANKFFSKSGGEQLSTLTDVLSSAGRRAINLLKHDQLFNVRTVGRAAAQRQRPGARGVERPGGAGGARRGRRAGGDHQGRLLARAHRPGSVVQQPEHQGRAQRGGRGAAARVGGAREGRRRRRAGAGGAARAHRAARGAQKINDQERALNMQIASNGAAIARAEAEKQAAVRKQREAELGGQPDHAGPRRRRAERHPAGGRGARAGGAHPGRRRGRGRGHPT